MSYESIEKIIYETALDEVERTQRLLIRAYQESLEKVREKILAYNAAAGFTSPDVTFRLYQLEQQINAEITALMGESRELIYSGFADNYQNTYLMHAYNIEREVNVNPILYRQAIKELDEKGVVRLPFSNVPTKAVEAAFNEKVGAHRFVDRIDAKGVSMQFRIQDIVARAVAEGQTVKNVEAALAEIDDLYKLENFRIQATARTELLRAFSIGSDQAMQEAQDAGVDFKYKWSSALDGHTRPDHVTMDGKIAKPDADGTPVFTLPGGSKAIAPRIGYKGPLPANQAVNCRCRRLDLPFGIEPSARVAALPDTDPDFQKCVIAKMDAGMSEAKAMNACRWVDVPSATTAKKWMESKYNR